MKHQQEKIVFYMYYNIDNKLKCDDMKFIPL